VIRGEHHSINRHDCVKRGVRKWKPLRVPVEKFNGEVLGYGPHPPTLQQGGNIVDTNRLAPTPGGGESRIAATCSNIQHAPTCLEVSGLTELLSLINNSGGHDGEVAAGPGGLLPLLHGREIWA
jgi:hypothetical protein